MHSQVRSKASLRLHLSNQNVGSLSSKCQLSWATNFTLSSEQVRNDWWMRMLFSTKYKWVFISSDSWASSEISRLLFFTVFDSGSNVNARLGCGNEMTCVPQEWFPCCAIRWMQLFFFQLVQATLSCPNAAISSHKRDELVPAKTAHFDLSVNAVFY